MRPRICLLENVLYRSLGGKAYFSLVYLALIRHNFVSFGMY